MGIASSWSKGERLDHLDQNRLDGAVYWTEIGFSTYFDIPISSESYIFISSTASQVFIFSSPHILIFHQRSGMVGPFRPTPEYEAGYSCFQQVRFENQFPSHFDFQSSGQTPLLQTPSNHHEPPTVPTRNTNGGMISTWWYIGILFLQLVFVYFDVLYFCNTYLCILRCQSEAQRRKEDAGRHHRWWADKPEVTFRI